MSIRSLIEKMNSLSALNEGTKETKTGRVHKAEPGGYGRKSDEDETGKKVKPEIKKGRGRPKKDSDSDTGEVKKWSTDELAHWIVGSKPKTLPGKASVKHKLKDESIEESTKETKTGRVHKAEPGGYGRKSDEDETGKKVKPEVKKGRGRPKKDSDSDTGEVKKWDTDELASWIVGNKPKKLPGKASVKHKLKDESVNESVKPTKLSEWIKQVERNIISENQLTISPMSQQQNSTLKFGNQTVATGTRDEINKLKQSIESGEVQFPGTQQNQMGQSQMNKNLNMQQQPGLEEREMSSSEKKKEERLKGKYDTSNMKSSMKKQYGPEKGEDVYFATIRKQAMSESKKRISEGYTLEDIKQRFPYETKMCQEGWALDEGLYEALRHYYFENGFIPNKIMYGDHEECRNHVLDCYMKDTKPLLGEEEMDEGWNESADNPVDDDFIPDDPDDDSDTQHPSLMNRITQMDRRQDEYDYNRDRLRDLAIDKDVEESFIGGSMGGPEASVMDDDLVNIDDQVGKAVAETMDEDGEFPFPNEAMYESKQGVAEGSEDFKARLEKRRATLTPDQITASEKIMKKRAAGRGISNAEYDEFKKQQADKKKGQGVAEGSVKTPKITLVQANPGSNDLIDIFVDGRNEFLAAKIGTGIWSVYPIGEGQSSIGAVGSKSELKKKVLDYLSKQGVAEGKNKKEKSEMKKVKDTQMEAWDRQLHALLNEGMTVTTSTGQNGMGDSVSVSATDEDAQSLMKVLANAGIGMGAGMSAGMGTPDSTEGTAIEVEPMAPDEVMGQLQSSDDNGDADFSFLQRMLSSRNGDADEESESDAEIDSTSDDEEEKVDEVSKGQWLKQKDTEAEKSGKKSFKAFGQKFSTDEIEESDEEESDEEDEEDDESEDTSSDTSSDSTESDEDDEEEKVDESQETCNECGCAMTEGHQCSTELNEWANSRGDASKDESFKTELDYMTKLISGGLNGQKRDQTTLPHTKVKAEIVKENISESISKTMKKLAGIK